jgi:hypothetical protein
MSSIANFVTATEYNSAGLTTSFATVATLTNPLVVLIIQNDSTVAAMMSFNLSGVTNLVVPAGDRIVLDLRPSEKFVNGAIQIKSTGAGVGTIYISGVY